MHFDVSTKMQLLVVDDDPLVVKALDLALPSHWQVQVERHPHAIPSQKFHAAFVDMHLTGNIQVAEGADLIRKLKEAQPQLEVVAMSGNLDPDTMEKCLRFGADRFLAKPLNMDEVRLTLAKISTLCQLQNTENFSGARWIGASDRSNQVLRQIAHLKHEGGPILIEGETGTGKEVVAHLLRHQAASPFVAVNVAAIPENLFESELFGHVRGAFTGADQQKIGLAEAAHGGDLFLDEIEALSLPLQVKLLRFLETGEIRRVGSKDSTRVDTRVILATNQKLEKLVQEKKFREDLLWRISGQKIILPALRDRTRDIVDLAEHFVQSDKIRRKTWTTDALELLQNYSWPGNVRELKKVCEQAVLHSPLPLLRREDIQPLIRPPTVLSSSIEVDYAIGLPGLMNHHEAYVVKACLEQYRDVDEVARILKISRSSLYKKIKDYHIEWGAV